MKDIKDYEGMYAITEEGQVWSYKSKKFLKLIPDKDGYLKVNLYTNGTKKVHYIHRLVAEAYLPNPNNLPEVHHIDADKINNNKNNLEWISKRGNLVEMYIRQLKKLNVSIDEIIRRYE